MNTYLVIADTITAMKNDEEGDAGTLDLVVEALADAFKDNDPNFDRVQFLVDCELAEGEGK